MAKSSSKAAAEIKVRKASPSDTPGSLTHYTDLAGLKGIVENRQLWLSNAAFLNDPLELEHGIAQAKKILGQFLTTEAADDVTKARLKLVANIAKDLTRFRPPAAYITCFCERSDLLSQWRGYASRQGVSVTFNTKGLRSRFNEPRAEIQQIFYGTTDTKNELKSAMQQEVPDIVDDLEYMLGVSNDDDLRKKFFDLMAALVPRFKHFGFREEREWRLVVTNPEQGIIKFRPRGQLMLPYVELSANKRNDILPIRKVTIGPGVNDDAVLKSVQFFLEVRGYDPTIAGISTTPYRT